MPRPAVHSVDGVLDAARDLAVELGPRAVGIRAIAQRSGAPTGSLYHWFGSRDELLARAWLRSAERFQAGYLAALGLPDAVAAAGTAAGWCARFAIDHPADAMLLLTHSRATLLDGEPPEPVADRLATVNDRLAEAVAALAARLYRSSGPVATERVRQAVMDLPYGALRRHMSAGTLNETVPSALDASARALVTAPLST